MKMLKIFITLSVLLTSLNASFFDFLTKKNNKPEDFMFSEQRIAKVINQKAKKYGLDTRKLFTIASIESGFNPFAIAIETSYAKAMTLKKLQSTHIKIQVGRTYHSRIWLVTVLPDRYQDAVLIIETLEKLGFGFDVGLMQINTVNFTLSEVKEMLKPQKNIEKSARILKSCMSQFKNKVHQIECYNRGAGNLRKMLRKGGNYYPYYARYKRHWKRYF